MENKVFVTERKSYYEFLRSKNDKIPNKGFDYENRIFEKSLSNITYNGDTNRSMILRAMERVLYALIESAKTIRNYRNFMVPKNNKYVR